MASVLIDTDILIDVANKDANAISRFKHESQTAQLVVSSITVMELVVGADALIAATTITQNMPLLSKNQRDFRFIQELILLPYP